ncbi:histidine phosphatase family protein [Cellulomonas soli]
MTLTLTLVRHGQTYLNARRLLQGWSDSPLTRTGRAGVRVTAAHLAEHTFTGAYSSPSGRAIATATEILRHHDDLRLRTDKDLRELHFGQYERRPEHELDALAPGTSSCPRCSTAATPACPVASPAPSTWTACARRSTGSSRRTRTGTCSWSGTA